MADKKVAVVTGASKGIGKQIAIELAKEGNFVIVNYNGSKDKAEQVVEEIRGNGGEAEAVQCDVSQYEACENFFKEVISKYKRIDVLINNAGITKDNLIMKMKEEEFDSVIQTNLKGTFHCMKAVARQMLKQKSGRIINLSSVAGIAGNVGQANYAASKAGVIGMTKSVAKELASRGITVNVVAPGFIQTDMTDVLSEAVKENAITNIPLQRFGKPEDIAYTVAFLASDKASYITGQVISVDGGMVM